MTAISSAGSLAARVVGWVLGWCARVGGVSCSLGEEARKAL